MIPESKQPAVTRALHSAFGVSQPDELRSTSGGQSSALVFRIVVKGKAYLLKMLRAEIISDPAVEFACMQNASEAGIAPRIRYASLEDRLLITDFVEAKPYPEDMTVLIGPVIRRLQGLAGFQKPKMGSYFKSMDGFVRLLQTQHAELVDRLLPENAAGELFRGYAELAGVYPQDEAGLVASHNDLKPQNMVFDGERLWLVDWESAFLNDPYVDPAIVANFFVRGQAGEARLLEAVLGEPAGEYRLARFFLMRQAMHMFYAGLLLHLAARSGLQIAADLPSPDFAAFHRGLMAGEIDTLKPQAQAQYARLHMHEALRNMRTRRFAEALATVAKKA
jgi:Phosphotransferase enzyme family